MGETDGWWTLIRATVGTAARSAFRVRCSGVQNVPGTGGALLAYNHVSVLDAVFVAMPVVERGRVVHFFALAEDFERPVLGPMLRRVEQIPIRRGFGDWEAIEAGADVLRAGKLAGIAPEGTVGEGPALGPVQKGAARIALMASRPVIPIGIWGSQERWPRDGLSWRRPLRPSVSVEFGEPIMVAGDPKHRPDVQALTDRLSADIDALVARARTRCAAGRGQRSQLLA